ncbi:MAG TPA: Gfo/Idh/MocA family oxidoreductase [Clostridiaceae bacterium]
MRKIKIGVVGCGNISGIYLQNLTTLFANTEVYACCDLIDERAKAAAEKYHIPNILTTEELISSKEIEFVVNLTTPKSHYEICKRALLAGKHVYVEKPLALTIAEGKELVELATQKNLLLGSAPDTFLGAGLQTCRKLIDDGFIGTPVAATAFMTCHGHENWHPDPAFYYKPGAGPMFDMGPYYLTALVSLLGSAEIVCGMTKISFPERTITSSEKFGEKIIVEIPTHVAGTIGFKNGVIATVITSFDIWSSTLPRIEIYGSLGTLIVPDPNTFDGPVLLRTSRGTEFKEIPLTHNYNQNSRGIGVADMAKSIVDGHAPRVNKYMSNHVLELMHAFHISSDTEKYYKMTSSCTRPEPLPLGLIDGII